MLRVVALSIASVISLLTLTAAVGSVDQAAEEASGSLPFPHSKHVPADWATTAKEQPRDCRGCHDYDPAHPADPEQRCDTCHSGRAGQKSISVEGRLADMRTEGSAFAHADHLAVECRACHLPPPSERRGGDVPDDMWIPKGTGWCVACHDPKAQSASGPLRDGQRKARTPDVDRGFQEALNASPRMEIPPDAPFAHLDHIEVSKVNDPSSCRLCHGRMAEATGTDYGETAIDRDVCAQCHVTSATGARVEFGVDSYETISAADGTFYHKDHLRPSAEKLADIGDKWCLACHAFSDAVASGPPTYVVKKNFEKYDACMECHYHANDQRFVVENPPHGEIDNCYGCHVVGVEADMKTTRPTMTLDRMRPQSFAVLAQTHPHISSAGERTEACRACHVAEVAALPSRIGERRFSHAAHLPAEFTDADCAECHGVDAETGRVEARWDDGRWRTYKLDACAKCHRLAGEGARLEPVREQALQDPAAVRFLHSDHVKTRDGKPVTACADCHDFGADGRADDRDFAYHEGVLDCSKCHDHEKNAERTGGVGGEYVKKCAVCHKVGVPAKGQPIRVTRLEVHGASGRQFHPLPSDKACSDCHRITPSRFEINESRLVTADRVGYEKPRDFHKIFDYPHRRCFDCHWGNLGDPRFARDERVAGTTRANEIRRKLGDDVGGYPGGTGR